MSFYDFEQDDISDITEDMEKAFKTVIREAIKNCWSVGNYGNGEFRDVLMYKTCYGTNKTIGCVDGGDYLILSSDFIYHRLCIRWEEWMRTHKHASCLPEKNKFYEALYYANILPHGIFFQKPLYKFEIGDSHEKKAKWHFFIRSEYVGYEDSMVEWH